MLLFLRSLTKAAVGVAFAFVMFQVSFAQGTATKSSNEQPAVGGSRVTQIDIEGLKKLIKPSGKPLLINFWATWCDPCREEFPDLVKLDATYRGKINFLTISLDDLADINGDVPKFLAQMKAEMPAYLLHTPDESAAITLVSKDWAGNLPMTILFDADGKAIYTRNGKIRIEPLRAEINKVLASPPTTPAN